MFLIIISFSFFFVCTKRNSNHLCAALACDLNLCVLVFFLSLWHRQAKLNWWIFNSICDGGARAGGSSGRLTKWAEFCFFSRSCREKKRGKIINFHDSNIENLISFSKLWIFILLFSLLRIVLFVFSCSLVFFVSIIIELRMKMKNDSNGHTQKAAVECRMLLEVPWWSFENSIMLSRCSHSFSSMSSREGGWGSVCECSRCDIERRREKKFIYWFPFIRSSYFIELQIFLRPDSHCPPSTFRSFLVIFIFTRP